MSTFCDSNSFCVHRMSTFCDGPGFPKRESRARTSTRNQSYNWISSHGSFSDPNCQDNPQYSNLVRAYTTLGASDTGIHWRSTQTCSEGGFCHVGKFQKGVSPLNRNPDSASAKTIDTGKHWRSTQTYSEDSFSNTGKSEKGVSPLNRAPHGTSAKVTDTGMQWRSTQTYSENVFSNTGKSQKGVSPLNRTPDCSSAKVISHMEESIWSPFPARDGVARTTDNDVKRNIQPSMSSHKAELRIEQAARIALPSSPSDEDVSGETKTRVITPEQVPAMKRSSNTAAASVVKPSCSQPKGESALSDLEARRQMALRMILELQRQEMQDSGDESFSDSDSSAWETQSDSCSATSSATSITDNVNSPTFPNEDSHLTAILRARLAAVHIPQARKSKNSVSLDEKLHAIRYKPQPRAFTPWFDEDMVDYDNNVVGLLRPPARPRAPYEGDVIATLVPPMSKLSLKHVGSRDGGDDEHVPQANSRKRQHDDVPEVGGIKRSRTQTSETHQPIKTVTYGKRKAVEFDDTLHGTKRMRN
ncbi:uncharacterized protein [Haliotis asinina]|uniref:uncharacterized protein n=1 Tax=Haliotis asinina TaxID=109174 RepID=UPI0035323B8F